MDETEIKTSLNDIRKERQSNFKERIWFLKHWADYIKSHSDKDWSSKQSDFIDSQIIMAQRFYKNLEKTEEGKEILKRIINDRVNGKVNVLAKA